MKEVPALIEMEEDVPKKIKLINEEDLVDKNLNVVSDEERTVFVKEIMPVVYEDLVEEKKEEVVKSFLKEMDKPSDIMKIVDIFKQKFNTKGIRDESR